jgi:hypothetical protein
VICVRSVIPSREVKELTADVEGSKSDTRRDVLKRVLDVDETSAVVSEGNSQKKARTAKAMESIRPVSETITVSGSRDGTDLVD